MKSFFEPTRRAKIPPTQRLSLLRVPNRAKARFPPNLSAQSSTSLTAPDEAGLESQLDFEGSQILVGAKIFVFTFALDRIDSWYCSMYVVKICMACIIGLLDVVGVCYMSCI